MPYFERTGKGCRPTPLATGPWSDQVVGGGPVAALMAHALEQQLPDRQCRLSRLTVDLLRPAPNDQLEVHVQPVRIGQRVQILQAWLASGDAQYARATGVFCKPVADCPAHLPEPRLMQPADPTKLSTSRRGGPPNYASSMEVKSITYPDAGELGIVWIRFPHDLLIDVPLSPVSRTALTADAVSGFAFMTSAGVTAVNTDVTLYAQRVPVGEWLCVQVDRRAMRDGIAVARASLFDAHGLFADCMIGAIGVPQPMRMSDRAIA